MNSSMIIWSTYVEIKFTSEQKVWTLYNIAKHLLPTNRYQFWFSRDIIIGITQNYLRWYIPCQCLLFGVHIIYNMINDVCICCWGFAFTMALLLHCQSTVDRTNPHNWCIHAKNAYHQYVIWPIAFFGSMKDCLKWSRFGLFIGPHPLSIRIIQL